MANYPPYQNYMPMPQIPGRPQAYNMVDQNYPVIKGRPVSSFEEARASMIDFDGSVFYFPDLANQKIYTKQINMDGTATVRVYELTTLPQPQMPVAADYVTKEEFDRTINNLLQQIKTVQQEPEIQAPPQTTTEFKF